MALFQWATSIRSQSGRNRQMWHDIIGINQKWRSSMGDDSELENHWDDAMPSAND
jgi:hypothetical protein